MADDGTLDARRLLWLVRDDAPPHKYLVAACRRMGARIREIHWMTTQEGRRPFGRYVEFGRGAGREHPMSVQVVSPRLMGELIRAPEDVVVIYELGLVGLYAGLSKLLRRRRRVVSMVENDYRHLGRTGTAGVKVALRRFVARRVDVFVANSPAAKAYVVSGLGVPAERVTVGWWLAGLPLELPARMPDGVTVATDRPVFACAGRLIPQKGIDLLLDAVAVHRDAYGPCQLLVLGDGPERDALIEQAERLKVRDSVDFVGMVDHAGFKAVLEAADAFVFPTLRDLTGRVVVEALTSGVPVIASQLGGAAETLVEDGVNGLVADPRDSAELADAMHRAADPGMWQTLRDGVKRTAAALLPDAGADAILGAVNQARAGTRVRA